jgi:hypothetical protein
MVWWQGVGWRRSWADFQSGFLQPPTPTPTQTTRPPAARAAPSFPRSAPPKPLAALLSPVLWNLFNPDRFDMYSVGVTLLQMACPNLRSDAALGAFRK